MGGFLLPFSLSHSQCGSIMNQAGLAGSGLHRGVPVST